MSLPASLRVLHRRIAPWFLLPILFVALTGLTYRIGRAWFAMSSEVGDRILDLHTAEIFGKLGSVLFVLLVGGMLVFFVISGLSMVLTSKASRLPIRMTHRIFAVVLALPLLISAVTGMIFHVGDAWFSLGKETGDFLMMLHQGSWLGRTFRPFYVLLLAVGVVSLGITGLKMMRRAHKAGAKG
jgi:hypothetical protein